MGVVRVARLARDVAAAALPRERHFFSKPTVMLPTLRAILCVSGCASVLWLELPCEDGRYLTASYCFKVEDLLTNRKATPARQVSRTLAEQVGTFIDLWASTSFSLA